MPFLHSSTSLQMPNLSEGGLRHIAFVAVVLFCAGGLFGCGGQSRDSVSIDGSSTVFPLTEAVAEEFMEDNQGARVNVGVSGTGAGFSKFIRGETAINDASRPITPGEQKRAEENGVEYIELPVAYDGVAVVVHPENDWAECLTVDELRQIWEPDSDVERWSQVRDGFPNRPVDLYAPGTASGTYDYFTEAIVGESGASRSDFTGSEDDNVLVQGINGTETALGYFGLAYYTNNAQDLNVVAVDPDGRNEGASCVTPSAGTVQDGSYRPLTRPLFIYVNPAKITPAVESFIEFYLDQAASLAPDVGYVGMPEDAYDLARQRFRDRTTGTVVGAEEVDAIGVEVEQVLRSAAEAASSDTTTE